MAFSEGEVVAVERPKKVKQVKVPTEVVEVEKGLVLELDEDTSSLIAGLETNPGFQWLVNRLKLQRSVLETRLKTQKHETLRDVDYLQLGIQWCNWLENEVRAEVNRRERQPKPRQAFDYEEREFNRIRETLKLVGK